MVLSKNAEANIRSISDCLEEADIGTDSSLYILRGADTYTAHSYAHHALGVQQRKDQKASAE